MALPQTTLPLILPLSQAARSMGLSENVLRDMVQSGKVKAFVDPEGDMYVLTMPDTETPHITDTADQGDDINARLSQIRREDFAHLEGELITVSEASEEFGVPGTTIRDWIKRGYLHSIEGYPLRLNKAEMAFCAAIYKVRKEYNSRAPLLDKKGNPYLLKEPELARLRRLAKAG